MDFPPLYPRQYAAGQWIAASGTAALAVVTPIQVVIGLTVPGAFLFVLTAVCTLLLTMPLLLYLRATPPLALDNTGLTLKPRVGRPVIVAWDAVREVKPYPLLPPPDTETVRRYAAGRKKYTTAEGLMLTSDALPWTYKAVGWFAGEGWRGAFAVTNRSHAEYAKLKKEIEKRLK